MKLKKNKNLNDLDQKKTIIQKVDKKCEQSQKDWSCKTSKGAPPAMLARVESFGDSDFESHLSSSLESPSPKDNDDDDVVGKQVAREDGCKTDPSAPTSSLEESQSEGERDDYGLASSPRRKPTAIFTSQKGTNYIL
jgi:hypothetical protein